MNKIIRFIFSTILAASFAAASLAGAQANQTASPASLAPLSIGPGSIVPNQYIVVLKPASGQTIQASAISTLQASGGKLIFEYGAALNGFAAVLPARALLELRQNPQVAYVEADQIVNAGPSPQSAENDQPQSESIQTSATWGLDRIDQRALPLNGTYNYTNTGAGVNVYILGTGIRSTHVEFGGRATKDFDAMYDNRNGNDCNGRGTLVAGVIGGKTYGVAKNVNLHTVRILDCWGDGYISGVIAGVNWVAAHHINPAVANLSMYFTQSNALKDAVTAAIASGVTFVVPAGNINASACSFTPANIQPAITVGASESNDRRWPSSNVGPCVDIFAPGTEVISAYYTSDTDVRKVSDTALASAYVTGAAALYLWSDPSATPLQVTNALINFSTKNVVTDPYGSPNRLLFSQLYGAPVVPTPLTPIGSIVDTTPTYSWTKIVRATQYQYQLYRGTTLVYTNTVLASACGSGANCMNTPATVLPYAAYSWKVRALIGSSWQAFSAIKAFTLTDIPTPLTPGGTIFDTTPTYTWTRIPGATQYQYQLYQGATVIYTKNILTSACGALANCADTPVTVLPRAAYSWKVRAMLGGAWRGFSAVKPFTLTNIPTLTPTLTSTKTATPTVTQTPVETFTSTATASQTPTSTQTATPSQTPTATETVTPTATATFGVPGLTKRDIVLVIDRSESMGRFQDSTGPMQWPIPSINSDPVVCNSSHPSSDEIPANGGSPALWTGDCHPFQAVKAAAFSFVDHFMDPTNDRIAIVVFDNQVHPVNFGTAGAPVYLTNNRTAIEDAIRNLWMYDGFHDTGGGVDAREPTVYDNSTQGMACPYVQGAPIVPGTPPCRLLNGAEQYFYIDCEGYHNPLDGTRCGSTNTGQALQWAANVLQSYNNPNEALPATILLTDGVPNAGYDAAFMPICPLATRSRMPFCRDTNSSVRHAATEPSLYDVDDFARDQADVLGSGSLVFAIGLGNAITNDTYADAGTVPAGQALLNYIAQVGHSGSYFQVSTEQDLLNAFQTIGYNFLSVPPIVLATPTPW